MRALQEQDFDQMAARVVDRFMSGDKLADAATGEAMGGELNPDQIERLVETANTMAFLRLMEQQKAHAAGGATGPDMTHEFDPIDARQVIQQITNNVDVPHMGGGPEMSGGPEMNGMPPGPDPDMAPLPEEHGSSAAPPFAKKKDGDGDNKVDFDGDHDDDDNDGPFPKGKKQKDKDKEAPKKDTAKPPKKDETKEAAFRARRQRKLADVLDDQYKQAEWVFEDELSRMSVMLKRAHGAPTLAAFEKDALALANDEIGLVVQNMVRESRGWPGLTPDDAREKHAAIADRHLVTETDVTRAFERLVKIATEAAKLQKGAAFLRSQCS